jgi:hypothetical protein
MRALAAPAAVGAAALGLVLVVAERSWAQGDCQAAFEKWALMSSAQVRRMQEGGGHGACIPSESARRGLLEALGRARALCGDSSDVRLQPTRTLININHSFITSLGVCRTESASADEGWSIKTAPSLETPPAKTAAPLPPPKPPPATGGPRPSVIPPAPPKAVAVAPPKETAAAAPKPPCLEVAAPQGDVYALVNRRCKGHAVLAVIETSAASGETACKGYEVGVGVNLRGAKAPRVNYECVASLAGCNKDRLIDMFPECDW